MANLNKVILIGRLTRDPETRTFSTGGKVAKFGFAVTNRRKNTQSGQWEDEPMFIDVEVFNRGEFGTLANLVEERCRKGAQICIEGRLHLDQWEDKDTKQKRSKHKLVAESIQLLDTRQDGMGGAPRSSAPVASRAGGGYNSAPPDEYGGEPAPSSGGTGGGGGESGDDIPF
jgi:single-strand DNA-binding protein